ncbi:MAG: protein disulfide oxidoreductase [Chromatiaceae bacterium]|nr:MAG: protein disulfide oxidoreductase [Chromatiaceae bacterium]
MINLLIVATVFMGVQWYQARPLASGKAPPLQAALTSARPFNLATLRGEPVLVHFWANWCPVCKLEGPKIDALAADFRVITVAMQSGGAAEINRYLREQGLGFDVIADPDGEIATTWGVRGVPASFVIDPTGRIRFAHVGYTTGAGLRGRLWAAARLDRG